MRCSCRKNGMECSTVCSTCKETKCKNSPKEKKSEETLLMEDGQSFNLKHVHKVLIIMNMLVFPSKISNKQLLGYYTSDV